MKSCNLKTLFIYFICIIPVTNSKGQSNFEPGYIINNQNDTIYGLINNRSDLLNSKACIFKKSENDEKQEFLPEDINGYRFIKSGRYYVSSELIDKNISHSCFYEYLLKGKIDLYKIKNSNQDEFYVKKDTILVKLDLNEYVNEQYSDLLKPAKYKGQLRALMNDHPDIFPMINNTNGKSAQSLIKLSKKYQDMACPGESCLQFENKNKAINIKYGLLCSFGIPFLEIQKSTIPTEYYWSSCDFSKSWMCSLGAAIELQIMDISKRFYIDFDPSFSKIHFGADYISEDMNTENYIDFDLISLDFPVTLKYSFNSTSWKVWPFIGLGFHNYQFIKRKASFDKVVHNYFDSTYYVHYNLYEFSKFQNAIFISVGFDVPLKKHKILCKINYELGDGIYRKKYLDSFRKASKTSMISVTSAYYF